MFIKQTTTDSADVPNPPGTRLPDWSDAARRAGRPPPPAWLILAGVVALALLCGLSTWLLYPTIQLVQELLSEAAGRYRDAILIVIAVAALVALTAILASLWNVLAGLSSALVLRARETRLQNDQPIDRAALRRPEWHELAESGLLAHYGVQGRWADKSGLRGLTTSAPHIVYHNEVDALPGDVAEVLPALPGPLDMASLAFRPRPDAVLLGVDAQGPVVAAAPSLWHVATAGPTGNGKSNFHRLMMAQLLSLGAQMAVGDVKWTDYDAQQDEDWRPIRRRLVMPPAVSAGQIADLLSWSKEELDRRLAARAKGDRPGAPFFLVLDELPWIFEHVKNADRSIGELVRLGRGVGLFVMAAAQDFLVKTTGLSGARDNFRTCAYLGGDLKTGSVLLDMPQKRLAELELQLGSPGLAILRSAATTPARIVRIPYMSNAALYAMLGDPPPAGSIGAVPGAIAASLAEAAAETQPETQRPFGFHPTGVKPTVKPTGNPSETQTRNPENQVGTPQTAVPPEVTRILALFGEGKTIGEIVKAIHGDISGPRYTQARTEIEAVIRQHWKGN